MSDDCTERYIADLRERERMTDAAAQFAIEQRDALLDAIERIVSRIENADSREDYGDDYEAEVRAATSEAREALDSIRKGEK